MAIHCFRFHRFLRQLSACGTYLSSSSPASILGHRCTSQPQKIQTPINYLIQSRMFMASRVSNAKREYKLYKEGDEITEDTILFEGCDYNHWLITVDFPKEKELKPPPEEMVATYERICAQGLNISVEEAKKRIYACSTSTYEGFQAVMTEEESEKFKDVNGVVFVLPDSYIDPQNKEYGGDKYENGKITHRPPPVQYQRVSRSRDRYNDRPRYGQQVGPIPNQQRDGRSQYGPPQNWQPGPPQPQPQAYPQPPQPQTYPQPHQPQTYPQPHQPQTYPQPPQPQTYSMPHQPQTYPQPSQPQTYPQPSQPQTYPQPSQPQTYPKPPQPQTYPQPPQPQTYSMPPQPQTYSQPPAQVQGQGNREQAPGGGQQWNYNYPTPTGGGQGERMPMNNSHYGPRRWDANQPNQTNPSPSFPPNYNQGHQGSYYTQDQRSYAQRNDGYSRGYNGNFAPNNYGYRQDANPGYGQQPYPSQPQGPPSMEQKNTEQDQGNPSGGPSVTGQASF